MDLHEALEQIDSIRGTVAQAETFRGYRAVTVASTGILGIAAAAIQPWWVADPSSHVLAYVDLWTAVALASVLVVAAELTLRWFRTDSLYDRTQTLRAVEQFMPCLLAGGAVTGVLAYSDAGSAMLLPGLWAICFSLGIFASLRHMPPAVKWPAAYYMLTGAVSLAWARGEYAFTPWAMAVSFGGGQLLLAAVLYRTLEHADDE